MIKHQGIQLSIILVTAASISGGLASAIEKVQIDSSSGAPRIVVDGKPVRARMFWGVPGARPLRVGPSAQTITFDFSPVEDEPGHASMHFRFGQTPGEIFIDDIRVTDLDANADVIPPLHFVHPGDFDGEWNVWPPASQNTVGTVKVEQSGKNASGLGLHVSIKSPADGQWPDFHINHHSDLSLRKDHHYHVSFVARAEPPRALTVAFYGPTFQRLGGPGDVFERQIRLAAAADVPFVSFPMEVPWPKPGEQPDFSPADAMCRHVLSANPAALLVPRIDVNAPAWWMEAHPDELMAWDDGPHPERRASPASGIYRREAAEKLSALVMHLESTLGAHIAGYHPTGQNTGEWFYQDAWEKGLNGYGASDRDGFRAWLKSRYGTDAALRAAWRDDTVSLESATVPPPAARRASPAGPLRDPVTERPLIDFAEFQQRSMADCVCDVAAAVRRATGGRKLIFFFYGYEFEFGVLANNAGTSGHYDLRHLLDCPDIDVICSPISYFDRGLGQGAPAMSPAESVAVAGKMWLDEDDTHTYLASGNFPGIADHVDSAEKTEQELLRNTGQCAIRNFGTWWMDLGSSGWFDDPALWEQMKKLNRLDSALLAHPSPFRPEVAAVIDERSVMRAGQGSVSITGPCVSEARRALGQMGAPYGQYLLDDVTAGRVHPKMYVFLSAWRLDAEQRRQLLAVTRGATRVWCYAPGWQEEHTTSIDAMRELTGFQLKRVSGIEVHAEPTGAGKLAGLGQALGEHRVVQPLFAVSDASPDESLAHYSDGSCAIAMRKSGSGIDLFVGPPGLSSDLLRIAAREAGVHLFTQTDCNVYANGPFIVVHPASDGR